MIAITKEFKQMLQELFDAREVTELPVEDLVKLLSVSLDELRLLLKDEQIKSEYRLTQANDGSQYVKRFLQTVLEGKQMTISLNIQWDNIGGCPCFTCHELDRCDIGNPISSVDCPLFSRWLFTEPQQEEEKE
ncbi:MAG: hypothetical protein ACTSPM_11695 [Candidatus Heimdallarchaeota archaeon]